MVRNAIPRNNNVFVVPFDAPDLSKGGIYIPEMSQFRPSEGVVVAVGPKVTDELIAKGKRVVFGPFAPHQLRVDVDFFGEVKQAYVLNEEDIIAVVDETGSSSL